MPQICNTCGIQISEEEGDLESHNELAHGINVYYRPRSETSEEELYETVCKL